MQWAVMAGILAGLVLGFLGAGGTVVGLPVLLYLARLHPHTALGTNAAGVAVIALALLGWRARRRDVPWREALTFAVPGAAADLVGAQLGLVFPGGRLVALLGLLLFAVAGWLAYLSVRPEPSSGGRVPTPARMRPRLLAATAVVVGLISGFFAIGGGFMVVPGLALAGGLDLLDAASGALLPIAAFAATVASRYLLAGAVRPVLVAAMVFPGIVGGAVGVGLAHRMPRRALQRVFAAVLVLVGAYMAF